jgi:hypothetical protein
MYLILHRVYIQNYDDPKDEFFTTYTLIITHNILRVSRSEASQKNNYSENYVMAKFRMILEPDLPQDISMKV